MFLPFEYVVRKGGRHFTVSVRCKDESPHHATMHTREVCMVLPFQYVTRTPAVGWLIRLIIPARQGEQLRQRSVNAAFVRPSQAQGVYQLSHTA
jgi:hypothetical protein